MNTHAQYKSSTHYPCQEKLVKLELQYILCIIKLHTKTLKHKYLPHFLWAPETCQRGSQLTLLSVTVELHLHHQNVHNGANLWPAGCTACPDLRGVEGCMRTKTDSCTVQGSMCQTWCVKSTCEGKHMYACWAKAMENKNDMLSSISLSLFPCLRIPTKSLKYISKMFEI